MPGDEMENVSHHQAAKFIAYDNIGEEHIASDMFLSTSTAIKAAISCKTSRPMSTQQPQPASKLEQPPYKLRERPCIPRLYILQLFQRYAMSIISGTSSTSSPASLTSALSYMPRTMPSTYEGRQDAEQFAAELQRRADNFSYEDRAKQERKPWMHGFKTWRCKQTPSCYKQLCKKHLNIT